MGSKCQRPQRNNREALFHHPLTHLPLPIVGISLISFPGTETVVHNCGVREECHDFHNNYHPLTDVELSVQGSCSRILRVLSPHPPTYSVHRGHRRLCSRGAGLDLKYGYRGEPKFERVSIGDVAATLRPSDFRRHVMNRHVLAYTTPEQASYAVIDIDLHTQHDWQDEALAPRLREITTTVIAWVRGIGGKPVVETSSGSGGYHIWFRFSDEIESKTICRFLRAGLREFFAKTFVAWPGSLESDSNHLRMDFFPSGADLRLPCGSGQFVVDPDTLRPLHARGGKRIVEDNLYAFEDAFSSGLRVDSTYVHECLATYSRRLECSESAWNMGSDSPVAAEPAMLRGSEFCDYIITVAQNGFSPGSGAEFAVGSKLGWSSRARGLDRDAVPEMVQRISSHCSGIDTNAVIDAALRSWDNNPDVVPNIRQGVGTAMDKAIVREAVKVIGISGDFVDAATEILTDATTTAITTSDARQAIRRANVPERVRGTRHRTDVAITGALKAAGMLKVAKQYKVGKNQRLYTLGERAEEVFKVARIRKVKARRVRQVVASIAEKAFQASTIFDPNEFGDEPVGERGHVLDERDPVVLKELFFCSSNQSISAALTLGSIGRFDILIEGLGRGDPTRCAAIHGLAWSRDPTHIQLLKTLQDDPSFDVREAVAEALA